MRRSVLASLALSLLACSSSSASSSSSACSSSSASSSSSACSSSSASSSSSAARSDAGACFAIARCVPGDAGGDLVECSSDAAAAAGPGSEANTCGDVFPDGGSAPLARIFCCAHGAFPVGP